MSKCQKIASLFSLFLVAAAMVAGCAGKPAAAGGDAATAASGSTAVAAPSGSGAADARYFDEPSIGLRFRLPEVWYQALYESPRMTLSSYLHGFAFDYHTAESLAALQQLFSSENLPQDEADFTPAQRALDEAYRKGTVPLCAIAFEKEGERDEELRSLYTEERVLGQKNGTTYTLLTNPGADLSALSQEEQEQYRALLAATADFDKEMTLSGVREMDPDAAVSFSSKTVAGDNIDSSVFRDNTLTVINIWATWCGPCVGELPELQTLSEQLPEGVQMLGICTDGAEEADTAAEILEKAGVQYDNVAANEEMLNGFLANVQAYPTTIFVDSAGNMVGEPYSGAPSGDVVGAYEAEIQNRLAMLGQ